MAEDKNEEGLEKIWLDLGRAKKQTYMAKPEDKTLCDQAEKLVNALWSTWMKKYVNLTKEEVNSPVSASEVMMSRAAFRIAMMYAEERMKNAKAEEVLAEFEKKLDDILVKVD